MRVVLDTDVVVAALRSTHGASRQWLRAVLRREVELALSVPLVLQYEEVLLRAGTLAAIKGTETRVLRLLDLASDARWDRRYSYSWRPALRDPNDEMVLETAIHGHADWTFPLTVQPPGLRRKRAVRHRRRAARTRVATVER